MTELKLWHDSDGCVAAWDFHARTLLEAHPDTIGDAAFWEIANAEPRFWNEMPLIEGALEYWEKIRHLNPTVLTGAPKGAFEAAVLAKKKWWLDNFNHTDVIVCLSKNKYTYVTGKHDVLVDDTPRMVKAFEKAGGTAILHRSFDETLQKLKELGFAL